MPITTVLFDLDGTLLPMNQELFVKAYFGGLAAKAAPHGYESEEFIRTIWRGVSSMVKNDGSRTNEQVFWQVFEENYGKAARADEALFDDFYRHEFGAVQAVCGYTPKAKETVQRLKENGLRLVLATNPLFPRIATESRIRWAGLEPEDFEYYTTYETSRYCKPNLAYYRDILAQLGVSAQDCVMVGNDVGEDMVAEQLGMKVFLLTDCLISKEGVDSSRYPSGDFDALQTYLLTCRA